MPNYSTPAFGTSIQTSDLQLLLTDQLNGMGDYLTQEVGSLNWIECMVYARALATANQFITLMSNQLSPNSSSIFLDRWAQIYNTVGLANADAIENYIEAKQAQFGTPPSLSNLTEYFKELLGSIFINLQVAPELQPYATTNPQLQIVDEGLAYNAPLTRMYVYVWQPRDNEDNLLMSNATFNSTVETYRSFIEAWNPAYTEFITMNLTNRGFQDGYANNYNGLNYNNYLDVYNVVSGTAGSPTITGTGTAFYLYPNGQIGDFETSIVGGFNPPIQIVDDLGVLQTYFVKSVASNTTLTLTTNLINNITNRTYRCLGQVLDTSGMLDYGMLSNSGWYDVLPFTPAIVPDCVLWVRGDLGITQSSGVTAWADQSGNGDPNRNFVSTTGNPTYNASDAAYNNQSTLSFNGSTSLLENDTGAWSVTLTEPYTVFIVGNDTGSGEQIYLSNTGANVWYLYDLFGTYNAAGSSSPLVDGTANSNPNIYEIDMNDPNTSLRINAITPTVTGNTSTSGHSLTGLIIGGTTGGAIFQGKIAEVVVYSGTISTSNRASLFNYFSARYGISVGP